MSLVEADDVPEYARVECLKLALLYLQSLEVFRPEEIKLKLKPLMYANLIGDVLEDAKAEGFEEGIEKGIEKGIRDVIAALILNIPDANDDAIASLCSKSTELVAQVRREMQAGKGEGGSKR